MLYISQLRGMAASVLLPLVLLAANPAAAADVEQARQLVRSATTDAMAAFAGKKLTPDEARNAMRQLIARYGDMETESRYMLGRYWSRSTSGSQQEFAALLERFVVAAFGGMVNDVPADQRIEVRNADIQGDRVVVHSNVSSPGEETAAVDWIVAETAAGRPVIVDISAEGVTLLTTLQADFTSVIRSSSGKLEALFEPLRRKVSTL